jgi:hypothetical protein
MPNFTKMTPEQIALLNVQNNAPTIKLTPKEKFDRIAKPLGKRLRKFHFNIIESGKEIHLFNGLGEDLGTFSNDVKGARLARELALSLFNSASPIQQNGGYLINSPNYEALSDEEIVEERLHTMKLMEYHPFNVCKDCKGQFEDEEFKLHRCILGRNWVAVYS